MSTHTQEAHWHYTMKEYSSPGHQKVLQTIFSDPCVQVVYDIGANVGATTSLFRSFALANGRQVKIVAFEPDEENAAFFRTKHSSALSRGDVVLVPTGVFYGKTSASVHIVTFFKEDGTEVPYLNVGGWSIDECAEERARTRRRHGERVGTQPFGDKKFQLNTVENLTETLADPDFVKIDVEGAEANILMHSSRIKRAKYLLVEWNQQQSIEEFVKEHLQQFDIVDFSADVLLKRRD